MKRNAAASGAALAGLTLGVIIGAAITYGLATVLPVGKPYTFTSTLIVAQTPSSGSGVSTVSILRGAGSNSSSAGYDPRILVLVVGVNNTVVWANFDNVAHTVTSASGQEPFNSGNLQPGQFFYHTFSKPGNYTYTCAYHGWMVGNVVVKR